MPIDFACPSCSRQYRVKDELAGKNAKCGKCGHRMPIPQLVASASAISKSAASTNSASAKAPAAKVPAAKATFAKSIPTKAVPAKPVQKSKGGAGAHSWLDEELEGAQSTVVKAPVGPQTPCPACGQPLAAGAVLCVTCGYDTRTKKKLETKHVGDEVKDVAKKARKREQLGYAGSLLRGTVFSFIGAMLGAAIWAVFTYLTMWQSSYIALALGGLTGFGMALGHEDEDGTTAGIIAAFMSLFGIVAAKVMIVVIIIASFVIQVAQVADPIEAKRMSLVHTVAAEKLEAEGIEVVDANDEQWEDAYAKAEAELDAMNEQELEARFQKLVEDDVEEGEAEEEAVVVADDQIDAPERANAQDEGELATDPGDEEVVGGAAEPEDVAFEDTPSPVGLFFSIMFSPIDGIFILLAFFTAYKVGSGEMTD